MTYRTISQAYAEYFHITVRHVRRIGTECLTMCKSDEARRLLLGIDEYGDPKPEIGPIAHNVTARGFKTYREMRIHREPKWQPKRKLPPPMWKFELKERNEKARNQR
jgi:hypothetical protein